MSASPEYIFIDVGKLGTLAHFRGSFKNLLSKSSFHLKNHLSKNHFLIHFRTLQQLFYILCTHCRAILAIIFGYQEIRNR
jgi:hypothetical protein